MRKSEVTMSAVHTSLVSLLVLLMMTPGINGQALRVGFYNKSCPSAEHIVRDVVTKAVARNPGFAAGLIRLSFHDCFVGGCEASLLLTATRTEDSEQEAAANSGSLRGLEVIDEAKTKLEAACPRTVSCADILTFAARDAIKSVGGFSYNVSGGRLDGIVSHADTVNLPSPFSDLKTLIADFAARGMTVKELVALSGAHSIGIGRCGIFSNRLYSFNTTHAQDPSLDPTYAAFLKRKCPKGQGGGIVNFDPVSPIRLDNQYYKNLNVHKGLITSDQVLLSSPVTSRIVANYIKNPALWARDFSAAMIRMNNLGVLTGKQGEIRVKCGVKN